nr:hypothetical protein BaRGS_024677 [Batillaria attramentaria]
MSTSSYESKGLGHGVTVRLLLLRLGVVELVAALVSAELRSAAPCLAAVPVDVTRLVAVVVTTVISTIITFIGIVDMRPPRTVGAASSACWLCAVLDVLSALSLPPGPSRLDPRDGVAWGGARTRTRDRRVEDRRRYLRSSGPHFSRRYALDHDFAVNDHDVTVTEVLQFIDTLEHTKTPENCTQKNREIFIEHYAFKQSFFSKPFAKEAEKAIHVANVLNNLFLYSEYSDVHRNVTYFALAQSLVDSEPRVMGAGIVFELGQYPSSYPNSRHVFFPYAYRDRKGLTVVSDLTSFYYPFNTSWFLQQRGRAKYLKRMETIFTNTTSDVNDIKKASRFEHSVHVTEKDGYWDQPYYDCHLGAWIVQFSVPFYQVDSKGVTAFK